MSHEHLFVRRKGNRSSWHTLPRASLDAPALRPFRQKGIHKRQVTTTVRVMSNGILVQALTRHEGARHFPVMPAGLHAGID